MIFLLVVLIVATFAGATASVTGFGIGSILTPLLAIRLGAPGAIAATALPHACATCLRAWRLRHAVAWRVFRWFGVASAAGGLAGSLAFGRLGGGPVERVLGILLLLTAASALSGWAGRVHLPDAASGILGAVSGFLGGIVGNQGGLRAGALLGLGLSPAAFVATSTLTGVVVDLARTPLYVAAEGATLQRHWALVVVATVGTTVGTLIGERVLVGIAPPRFLRLVAGLVGLLGAWLLWRSLA